MDAGACRNSLSPDGSRRRALTGLVCLALGLGTGVCRAQSETRWPNRPVRLIVPFPAGSASDIVARIIGQKLGTLLGQQFVIDNRSGASGNIGADALAHAAPDGYTIGVATNSTHGVATALSPRLSYNPLTDFAAVSMIGSSPYVLAVYPGLAAATVSDLIALATARPGALTCGSAGQASLAHLAGALFSQLAKVRLTHVPYRSSAQAVLDVTEGRIDMQFGTLGPTLEQIRDGKLRALAVTSAKRIDALPQVPTLQEAGLAGYEAVLWMAVMAPAGTPPAIVMRLNQAMRDGLAAPDVVAALKLQEMEPGSSAPEAVQERISVEIAKWRSLAAAAGFEVEP
jgi:tripartite-type tricarboxylate transporter receptor subunit TctC